MDVVGHDGYEPIVRELLRKQMILHEARVGMMDGRGHSPTEATVVLQVPNQSLQLMLVSEWLIIGATHVSHTERGAGLSTFLGLLDSPDVCPFPGLHVFDAILPAYISRAVAVVWRGEHIWIADVVGGSSQLSIVAWFI